MKYLMLVFKVALILFTIIIVVLIATFSWGKFTEEKGPCAKDFGVVIEEC